MARTAPFDPIVVTLGPSATTIMDLVTRKSESAKLDYKERYAARDRLSAVRLAKHVLAMANTAGGYVVIGVKDDGTVCGLTEQETTELDEATIRQQVAGFSSVPISLSVTTRFECGGHRIAVVAILPLLDRVAVATCDGQFVGRSGNPELLFRKGDVFVRRGSSGRGNVESSEFALI